LATANVTVAILPVVAAITGTTNVCTGNSATLSTTTTGGSWSSAMPLIATVSASGAATPTGCSNSARPSSSTAAWR
jgi:hypothetical protein